MGIYDGKNWKDLIAIWVGEKFYTPYLVDRHYTVVECEVTDIIIYQSIVFYKCVVLSTGEAKEFIHSRVFLKEEDAKRYADLYAGSTTPPPNISDDLLEKRNVMDSVHEKVKTITKDIGNKVYVYKCAKGSGLVDNSAANLDELVIQKPELVQDEIYTMVVSSNGSVMYETSKAFSPTVYTTEKEARENSIEMLEC